MSRDEDDNDTPVGPEIVEVLRVSLGDIQGPLIDLSERQQAKQSSNVFEAFGMHWMLTLESQENDEDGEDDNSSDDDNGPSILVVLWCLSSKISSQSKRENFPLKGYIDVPNSSDGEPRVYNGREGVFCNLIGEDCPADAVKFDSFKITLCSGTARNTELVKATLLDPYGDPYGGYYDETWNGIGQLMLQNFEYDPVRHGNAVEIRLQFLEEEPWGLRKFGKRLGKGSTPAMTSSVCTPSPNDGKKRKSTGTLIL